MRIAARRLNSQWNYYDYDDLFRTVILNCHISLFWWADCMLASDTDRLGCSE